jgi:monofunctional biosynthetic peptidoglycan transglycosylase
MPLNRLFSRIWRYAKTGFLVFLVFTISGVIVYRFIPVPFTFLMFQRVLEQTVDGKKVQIQHDWVSIEKISPNMILAAVAAEDNNFVNHFGIDYEAIKKAYKYNQRGRQIRGASTITQQTCKNIFLWNSRNYIRKGLEVYFTFLVEILWSKERIMEVYLNSIEMGNGIYGIEAASQKYFRKPASDLNRFEAALIAASFPNPRKRNPAAPSAYLKNRQQRVMTLMKKIGEVNF